MTVLALDVGGNAGQAYRLHLAAFARVPDVPGLRFQTAELDGPLELSQAARNFLAPPELRALCGDPATLGGGRFVEPLYQNVLGRGPDAAGLAFHKGSFGRGLQRHDLLVEINESPEQ